MKYDYDLSPIFNTRFPSQAQNAPAVACCISLLNMKETHYFTEGEVGAEGFWGAGEGGWGLMLGWYLKINFGLLKI